MGIVLYCQDTPELKLGPGGPVDPSTVTFRNGFAYVPELTDELRSWINHPGTPKIEIMEEGQAPLDRDGAEICDRCGKAFGTRKALGMHKLSHIRADEKAAAAASA